MINRNRITRGIADLEAIRTDLAQLLAQDQNAFLAERRNGLALRYVVIQVVEVIVDLCQHLLASGPRIPCADYVDCLFKAGEQRILSPPLAQRLRQLAVLRNMLVHRYWIVDDARLYTETKTHQNDLRIFVHDVETFVRTLPSAQE